MTTHTPTRQYQLPPNSRPITCSDFIQPLHRLLNDRGLSSHEKEIVLANYFHDVFHILLGKLVALTDTTPISSEEEEKMRGLLEELIRVKKMLREQK